MVRLNHGHARTRYEHEVYSARDAYAALLVAYSKESQMTPALRTAILKVGLRANINLVHETLVDLKGGRNGCMAACRK